MSEPFDLAAHDGALNPEERAALLQAASADPSLAHALEHWRAVRHAIAVELSAAAPADELILFHAIDSTLLDVLDEPERARLAAARPALEEAFSRHPALADLAGRLGADAGSFEEVWARHTSEGEAREAHAGRPRLVHGSDRPAMRKARITPLWRYAGRLAAVIALVSLAAIATVLLRRDAGMTRIVASEAMALDLADGSSVELAAGAELLVPRAAAPEPGSVSGDAIDNPPRYARLVAGNALFRVARAAEQFVVETPAASLTVLGTTFGVSATRQGTDVVLVSGLVEVSARSGGPAVRLSPGQASRVEAGRAPAPAASADIDEVLAWTGSIFVRAETLAAAAARLGAAHGVEVQVDSTLATEAVTGRFDRSAGAEANLRALALAVDARLEAANGGFRLVPAGD